MSKSIMVGDSDVVCMSNTSETKVSPEARLTGYLFPRVLHDSYELIMSS